MLSLTLSVLMLMYKIAFPLSLFSSPASSSLSLLPWPYFLLFVVTSPATLPAEYIFLSTSVHSLVLVYALVSSLSGIVTSLSLTLFCTLAECFPFIAFLTSAKNFFLYYVMSIFQTLLSAPVTLFLPFIYFFRGFCLALYTGDMTFSFIYTCFFFRF